MGALGTESGGTFQTRQMVEVGFESNQYLLWDKGEQEEIQLLTHSQAKPAFCWKAAKSWKRCSQQTVLVLHWQMIQTNV